MEDSTEGNIVYTIGHSTRTFEELVDMLHSFDISLLADIRSYPGSRRYPQFNKETLQKTIPENGISYMHLVDLGGRRRTSAESTNTLWRNAAFRGYADYMQTSAFNDAVKNLEKIARGTRTAYMCSEAVWWRCHRSMVSDYLKVEGWKVMHIMEINKAVEHPYTQPARLHDGKLSYSEGVLLRPPDQKIS